MSRTHVSLLALLAAMCAGASGCKARDFGWQFRVAPSIDGATRAIVARVREDGCGGSAPPLATLHFRRSDTESGVAPALPPGTYALEVIAVDTQCRAVGRGCASVTLPESRPGIVIDVIPQALGEVCGPGGVCDDGLCAAPDAG